ISLKSECDMFSFYFFFSSRRRHTRFKCDWSSDVCSSDISKDAIPAALEKATRYRLLNEPAEAESICLDVLKADPENQEAIVTLVLALTDRFSKGYGVSDTQAKELLARIKNEYERAHYTGIFAERRAKTKLTQNTPD